MEKIELTHREILFLSDLLGERRQDIADELEEIAGDPELDNVELEMLQDVAHCLSIRAKLEKVMNG